MCENTSLLALLIATANLFLQSIRGCNLQASSIQVKLADGNQKNSSVGNTRTATASSKPYLGRHY